MSPQAEQAASEAVEQRPVLRVVRGTPDATELAALVAVVSAAAAGGARSSRPVRPAWANPERSVRTGLPSGGWRASAAPR